MPSVVSTTTKSRDRSVSEVQVAADRFESLAGVEAREARSGRSAAARPRVLRLITFYYVNLGRCKSLILLP